MGDLRQAYRLMVQPLVAAGLRVVTMDQRGHGQSSSRDTDADCPFCQESRSCPQRERRPDQAVR